MNEITKECLSCGKSGHTYAECREVPFTSLIAKAMDVPDLSGGREKVVSQTIEKVEHAPTPWTTTGNGVHRGSNCVAIAEDDTYKRNRARAHANAAFIALACNSHDALVKVCKVIEADLESRYLQDTGQKRIDVEHRLSMIRDALQLAGVGRGNSSDGEAGSTSSLNE